MTTEAQSIYEAPTVDRPLDGERIAFVGRLSGLSRTEATEAVVTHGGEAVSLDDATATIIVLGDEHVDLPSALGKKSGRYSDVLSAIEEQRIEVVRESILWRRIGLVDDVDIRRLYTPAMLAELLGVPTTAVRHWLRVGAIRPVKTVRRLPYFDFEEVAVAKRLAQLYLAGCTLRVIDRKLAALKQCFRNSDRPIADPTISIAGRCIRIRRGLAVLDPCGQHLLPFDDNEYDSENDTRATPPASDSADILQLCNDSSRLEASTHTTSADFIEQLEQEALDWIDAGDLKKAADAYRTILMAQGPSTESLFSLANALYRIGELAAARERFYAVLEMDEDYVEARANLGCVLAELGDLQLAVSAFEGALARHPGFVDVHFHLAGALDRLGQTAEAEHHYRAFLSMAPESPWTVTARARLAAALSEDAL